ncbi:MAG: IclR family transcriptional regulator [Solirubrobacteraceae bacterium]
MTRPQGPVPSLKEGKYSQSLERGLAVLRVFTPERPVMGIAEIADELGMSRSTTHRYVISLVALRFLEQGASRKYRLGLRVADLGMSVLNSTGLRESRVHLEELWRRTSLTASIAVLDEADIVYVDRARSNSRAESSLGLSPRTGTRLPARCTALGKVLLAHLPEARLREVLQEITFDPRTPKTILTKTALVNALAETREQGFAVNDEECAVAEVAIAVPVRLGSGEVVAAVGVAARSATMSLDRLVREHVPLATSTALSLTPSPSYGRDF